MTRKVKKVSTFFSLYTKCYKSNKWYGIFVPTGNYIKFTY